MCSGIERVAEDQGYRPVVGGKNGALSGQHHWWLSASPSLGKWPSLIVTSQGAGMEAVLLILPVRFFYDSGYQ